MLKRNAFTGAIPQGPKQLTMGRLLGLIMCGIAAVTLAIALTAGRSEATVAVAVVVLVGFMTAVGVAVLALLRDESGR